MAVHLKRFRCADIRAVHTISLNHRISCDVDIFFQDAAALNLLSPIRNWKIRELSDDWQQPGNYPKIIRPEGDIDFLVTRTFVARPYLNQFTRSERGEGA